MKLLAISLLAATALFAAEPQFSDVFVAGNEGYPAYRIPSVIVSKKGTVLAFAEARQNLSDQAKNDIVLKRSTDGGATWLALQLLHDDGAHSLNNPTAVQEQQSGRIFVWYQRIPSHLKEHSKETATGLDGADIYRNLVVTSDDDGATWSAPQDVTATTKRPERATTICSGPGTGIQLTRGPHKGRLVIPFNEGPFGYWQNFAVFSDDAGKTWRHGADAPGALLKNGKSWINEVQMAELNDGSVRLDSRQFGGARVRKTSISNDGGTTWSPVTELPELTDPSCMAGLLRYSFDDAAGKGRLIHTGSDSTKRERGTVWLSTDDGATWPVKRELWPGSFAYSVPTRLAGGQVGVLFEAEGHRTIRFARFPIEWVNSPDDATSTKPAHRLDDTGKFASWKKRHEEKLALSQAGGVELVFLGDSITQNWEQAGKAAWDERYAPRKAANYGFGGDSTEHVLWRLDHGEWDGIAPKVCVLLTGTNNTRHSQDTPEEIATGIRAILDRLAVKSPQTKVLLLAILPRSADATDPWRQRCEDVNRHLPAFADGKRVHFLNLNAKLLQPDGTLTREIAPDLLHLSPTGYGVLADAMEPKLKELLGEK